jgi:hypothetical protein
MEDKLIEARQDVDQWLGAVIRACAHEQQYIREKGDITLGDIKSTWDLLRDSIARLRKAQEDDSQAKEAARQAQEDAMGPF